SIVDPDNPKTALSVRAMLTANLSALEFLPDDGKPFSIREWISDEDRDGFLFLTSRGDQHASLRGLISTWLEIAVNAMLSLAQDDGRRIWVILDELPTLHQVPSLQPGLAESRQFGGCFVLGVQVASALRDLYGRNGAETISGLCGTRVVLAAPDRDTAQWSADSLGRSEIEEVSEGYSYGANTIRDGVSLTPRRELRALALPSEIMRLPNLEGYLKFPGPFPVAAIRLKYVARPKAAERFVPRERDRGTPSGRADDTDIAASAPAAEPVDDDGIAIPEPMDPDEPHPDDGAGAPGTPTWPAARQGELELVPLPGEAGGAGSGRETPPKPGGADKDGKRKPDRAGSGKDGAIAAPSTTAGGDARAAGRETAVPEMPDPGPEANDEPAEPDGAEPRWWF
ncbi:MAG: type IV secretion system DNA-binding domain-containing protein, partial [Alphaproteobacteria bacterium]|nr:type IV secretion system DNA-binding domain-containing protein [Alphaproteobacteria bacterium]